MTMRFLLSQLNPELRDQAQAKLAEILGTRRMHLVMGDGVPTKNLPKKPRRPKRESEGEARLMRDMRALRLPEWRREYEFHPVRKWRFDFAWPDKLIAVEIDGGAFSNGRHTRGAGYEEDCNKLNAAALMFWRVLRFTTRQVTSGGAVDVIAEALGHNNKGEGEQ